MLISFLAFSFLAPKSPQIAFIARFYKADGHSSQQVYICDLDGGHRRALTHGSVEPMAVRWAGANRLCWIVSQGDRLKLVSMRWPSGKQHSELLPKGEWTYGDFRDLSRSPGQPLMTDNSTPARFLAVDPETGSAKLTSAPADPLERSPEAGFDAAHAIALGAHRVYWTEGVLHDGERALPKNEDANEDYFFDPKAGRLWRTQYSHDSTQGARYGFAWLDPITLQPHEAITDADHLDFWPRRGLFAMTTPRDLAPFGKKQVWANKLYVGDWMKGTRKHIVGGLAYFTSVSLQP